MKARPLKTLEQVVTARRTWEDHTGARAVKARMSQAQLQALIPQILAAHEARQAAGEKASDPPMDLYADAGLPDGEVRFE